MDPRVVLVTGAGSGIGRATALAFAEAGAKVCLADNDDRSGQKTRKAIEAAGGDALFQRVFVDRPDDVEAMVQTCLDEMGHLDCAFNNAGIEGEAAPTAECTLENWDRVMDTDLRGVWLCMRDEIPAMIDNGGGVIVNTASAAGIVGVPGHPAYVAAKHGVIGLTRTAALELAGSGIRVNAVAPITVDTPMLERRVKAEEGLQERLLAQHPMGRFATPEEVAKAVVWMCSDDASFVTGHVLSVDGGWTAQ